MLTPKPSSVPRYPALLYAPCVPLAWCPHTRRSPASVRTHTIQSHKHLLAGDISTLGSRSQKSTRSMASTKPSVETATPRKPSAVQILLWPPQLVGLLRLLLLSAGTAAHPQLPLLAYACFLLNFLLDGLDGILARRLNQATQFGAFMDVAVDLLSRGAVWSAAVTGPWSAFPILLEAFTFVCTHSVSSGSWKENYFLKAPVWVSAVMAKGFKTPAGCLTIAGLMGLPLWLYARRFIAGSVLANPMLGAVLIAGRLVCASVECWVLASHLKGLLQQDMEARAA